MNLKQDNTQHSQSSQQDDDDVYLKAHDLTSDMNDSKQIVAEVDAGRTAMKGDGVTIDENSQLGSDDNKEETKYLGEIEISHTEEVENKPEETKDDLNKKNNEEAEELNDEPKGENRLIPGSYDIHHQSPMHSPVETVPASVQDPFLMG